MSSPKLLLCNRRCRPPEGKGPIRAVLKIWHDVTQGAFGTMCPRFRGTTARVCSIYAKPLDRGLVDLHPEPRPLGQRHMPVAQRQRCAHQILREIKVREADTPVDVGHRA